MDAGYMSSREARHVLAAHGEMPKNFLSPQKMPQRLVLERETAQGIRRIGIIFFPEFSPNALIQKKQERDIINAGKKLMKSADLVIGISLWGEARDSSFLFLAAGAFDLILSSGPGGIFELKRQPDAPGIAHLRPVDWGMAVPYVDLLKWPDRSGQEDAALTFRLNIEPLGDDVPDDPFMAALLGQMPGAAVDVGQSLEETTAGENFPPPEDDIFSPAQPVNNCR